MNIALIAQDSKKELMVAFCIAYKAILEKHNLYATGTTGSIIMKATGLKIYKLSPGPLGGEQQVASRVAYNEIDLVICLRDSYGFHEKYSDSDSLFRTCDAHNIPFATNIATAEVLIKGVERGDFEWRELIRS